MKVLTRSILGCLAAGLLVAPIVSGLGTDQTDLKQRYEKKLASEFVDFGGWITDYDEARARAKEEGSVLFVYFSRSYAP